MRGVHRILEERTERSAGRVALAIRENGRWTETTYAGLSSLVRRFSADLAARGILPGDPVAILSESRPEWAVAFLAAARHGAPVVPLDPKLTATELRAIVADSAPSVLCASPRLLATARELVSPEILVDLSKPAPVLEADPREREPALEDCAAIVYTSGTTGRPKGVRLSYRNLAFQADTFERDFALGEGEVFLSMLPLNHVFELTCGLLSPLNAGAQVAYVDSLFPHEILEAVQARGATRMLTVPAFLRALHRAPAGGTKLPAFHCGGAPLGRELADALLARGVRVFEGYGLTETSPVIATNLPGRSRSGSVGTPLSGTEVRIAEDGEILVRGPHVMLGYKGDERAIDDDGWFGTGDLGHLDADGFLFVTGRKKSLIVLPTGKKVQPEEVEAVLAASPLAKEVCVVGSEEGVVAVAVPVRGKDAAAIEAEFAERVRVLAPFKRPARIVVLETELPKTTTGKVRRAEVLRILRERGQPR